MTSSFYASSFISLSVEFLESFVRKRSQEAKVLANDSDTNVSSNKISFTFDDGNVNGFLDDSFVEESNKANST